MRFLFIIDGFVLESIGVNTRRVPVEGKIINVYDVFEM